MLEEIEGEITSIAVEGDCVYCACKGGAIYVCIDIVDIMDIIEIINRLLKIFIRGFPSLRTKKQFQTKYVFYDLL